jgi:hypothetical protein
VINSSVLEMKLRKPISLILLAAVSMGAIPAAVLVCGSDCSDVRACLRVR